MFVFIDNRLECSKCKSKSFERVEYGNDCFVRCRECGHEGEHRPIIPPTRSSDDGLLAAMYAKSMKEPVAF